MPGGKQVKKSVRQTAGPEKRPPMETALNELLNMRKGGGLRAYLGKKENSAKYNAVVEAMVPIVACMNTPVGNDAQEVRQNITSLLGQYNLLVPACEDYLARRAGTIHGANRQSQVRKILELAKADMQGLGEASRQLDLLPDGEIAGLSWQNLTQFRELARYSRQKAVRLPEGQTMRDLTTDHGAASTVYKVQDEEGRRQFFKKEETLQYDPAAPDDVHATMEYRQKLKTKELAEELQLLPNARSYLFGTLGGDYRNISPFTPESYSGEAGGLAEARQLAELRRRGMQRYADMEEDYPLSAEAQVVRNPGRLNLKPDAQGRINVSRRNVATTRIADLLGVGHLVARSENGRIEDAAGNVLAQGNMMEEAKGQVAGEFFTERQKQMAIDYTEKYGVPTGLEDLQKAAIPYAQSGSTGSLQKNLTSLQVLDVLCGQQDRHLNNYFLQKDKKGRITGVQGIDNDFSFGMHARQRPDETRRDADKMKEVYDEEGNITLPHMDKQLAERILDLDDLTARFALADLIQPEEVDFFIQRLHEMKSALRKEMANPESTVFIERDSDWNEQTHEELLAAGTSRRLQKLDAEAGRGPWNLKDLIAAHSQGNYYAVLMDDLRSLRRGELGDMLADKKFHRRDEKAQSRVPGQVDESIFQSVRRA